MDAADRLQIRLLLPSTGGDWEHTLSVRVESVVRVFGEPSDAVKRGLGDGNRRRKVVL